MSDTEAALQRAAKAFERAWAMQDDAMRECLKPDCSLRYRVNPIAIQRTTANLGAAARAIARAASDHFRFSVCSEAFVVDGVRYEIDADLDGELYLAKRTVLSERDEAKKERGA